MKKILAFLIILSILMLSFASCDFSDVDSSSSNEKSEQSSSSSKKEEPKSNLGDYNVVIDSFRMAEDYQGNDVIIVKYLFTNNSDESDSFMLAVDEIAYQDGVELQESIFVDDSANYSMDNQSKKIRPGVTLAVEVAYELSDTTTDVEIEVEEIFSFKERKVTKTFSID
jgi:hypothetical protein